MRSKVIFFALMLLCLTAPAQKKQKAEPVKHDKELRDMIAFLQYMLNTLGDAGTSNRDKDVLVMESFTKIFRDGKVQIEDDLDENRKVITNKDVQAYLKDVDFFFKDVAFEFTIDGIETKAAEDDKIVYRVTLKRNLNGTNLDGKKVNNTITRFVEINYNTRDQDLRIVSIYTNEFNEKQALTAWWQSLSYEWQSLFRNLVDVSDTVSLADIKRMTSIDTLDLHGNTFIQNIEPLAQLLDLRRLNLSGTSIEDLTPIRNLTNIRNLNLSETKVKELAPLKYCISLERLNLSRTGIDSIDVVGRLNQLRSLDVSHTSLNDFQPLSKLTGLEHLNVSNTAFSRLDYLDSMSALHTLDASHTAVRDLSVLPFLKELAFLNLDSTLFEDISGVSSLTKLRIIQINHTSVASLDPFVSLPALQRIYCDHTRINQQIADGFSKRKPHVLVIFDSEDLRGWWSDLSPVWKDVLSRRARIGMSPSKEELAGIANIDSINVANYRSIKSLEPIARLVKLKTIVANNSAITDLRGLSPLSELQSLDISDTEVSDVVPLLANKKLRMLMADNTGISNIDTLADLPLERVYADGTKVGDEEVRQLLDSRPQCLVVYQTTSLENWWSQLSDSWKNAFQQQINVSTKPTRQNFHKLIHLEKLVIKDQAVNDLSALQPFLRLKELYLHATTVSSLDPLSSLKTLNVLHVTASPLHSLDAIHHLANLTDLNIANTPVEDLEPLASLRQLAKLDCSGTKVKKLKPLENLQALNYLDCSNTDVRTLRDVEGLSLRHLKCFNTKISSGNVSSFRERNPECTVVYYR